MGNYFNGYSKDTYKAMCECADNAPSKRGHYSDYDWACKNGEADSFDWQDADMFKGWL